jgi:two-component system, chemotaxis family, protein-glutamate methylesterase/glutaminase
MGTKRMNKIRVLIGEDSLTIRKRLVEIVRAHPDLELVGEAEDGKRALELCQELRPDVVTLDMMMPVMSGLSATEFIMAYCPTPILIVSASTNRGELFRTYDALAAGAIEALEKPNGFEPPGEWEAKFVAAVKLISRIKVITHPRARNSLFGKTPAARQYESASFVVHQPIQLIAIGASTGGPSAIYEILRALPKDFPVPILIVLHIGKPFDAAFAEWLDGLSNIHVRLASSGEPLPSVGQGCVIMAPPDKHLILENRKLFLTDGPERNFCRPSVDVLFQSLASEMGPKIAACLLTGMGRDGAQGLLDIRRRGGMTIAQDEATSVVFGMPKEAIALDAAERVLPIEQIAPTLVDIVARKEPWRE